MKRLEGKKEKIKSNNLISHPMRSRLPCSYFSSIKYLQWGKQIKVTTNRGLFPVALLLIFALQNICIPFSPPLFLRSPCLFPIFPISPPEGNYFPLTQWWKRVFKPSQSHLGTICIKLLESISFLPFGAFKIPRSVFDILPLASFIL